MVKKLLKLALVIALAGFYTKFLLKTIRDMPQKTADIIFFEKGQFVVSLENNSKPGIHGTGSFIIAKSGKSVIVTNKHVCEVIGEDPVIKIGNELIKAEVLGVDVSADICILDNPFKDNVGLVLADSPARVNAVLMTVGFPFEYSAVLMEGKAIGQAEMPFYELYQDQLNCRYIYTTKNNEQVCVYFKNVFNTSIFQFQGNSGSPVFNSEGLVIGIMQSTRTGTNFGSMVLLQDLKRVLDTY